jgi:hypothetical protein
MAAATITDVRPGVGKLSDTDLITIIGTNFADSPSLTKVYKRKHGATSWEAVTAGNIAWVSATEIAVTLKVGDAWDGGMNDIGVSVSTESAPEDSMEQALCFYTAGADASANIIVGPPDGVYISGLYMGDLAAASEFAWEEEIKKIYTQHSRLPVKTYKGDSTYTLSVPLAEWSLENIKVVMGSAASITAEGAGRRRLTFGGGTSLVVYDDVLLILPGPDGKKVALVLYRCSISASGSISWAKDENAKLPLKIQVLADTSRAVDDQVGYWEEWTVA